MYRLDASLFFAHVNLVRSQLRVLARQYSAKTIIIDLVATYGLDGASLDIIDKVLRENRENGIDILLVHVKAPVRDVLQKSGLMDKLGNGHIHDNFDDALASLNNKPVNPVEMVEAPASGRHCRQRDVSASIHACNAHMDTCPDARSASG